MNEKERRKQLIDKLNFVPEKPWAPYSYSTTELETMVRYEEYVSKERARLNADIQDEDDL